jgi:hypothetical protein
MTGEIHMVDILTIVMENSQIILLVISILLALVAKYFQNQASAVAEVVQSLTSLTQEILNDVADGVVTLEELKSIVAKVEAANVAIQKLLDLFKAPMSITEKFVSVFKGYKPEVVAALKFEIQNMQMKGK